MSTFDNSGVVSHYSKEFRQTFFHKLDDLSSKAQQKIKKWTEYQEEIERPTWDNYFLKLAFDVAERSHDVQTKVGAVLTNDSHEIIATGYNGLPRDVKDCIYPNLRPAKYPFFLHSENNLLLDCARQGKSTKGGIVYCTAEPCHNCLLMMWQAGIREIIHTNQQIHMKKNEEEQVRSEIFRWLTKDRLKVRSVVYNKVPEHKVEASPLIEELVA